jgi:aminoglycoside phosphotransferase (APT) family kinase protein
MGTADSEQAPKSIERPLRELLRTRLTRPQLDYAEKPTRLFGGNHTFVYAFRISGAPAAWDRPLVLRILRAHRAADEVVFESALQNALAPLAPRVLLHEVDPGPLGAGFQVMERVAGQALLLEEVGQDKGQLEMVRETLRGFRRSILGTWPRLLGETHARLHALPTQPVLAALEAVGMSARLTLEVQLARWGAELEALELHGLLPAHAWLCRQAPQLTEPFCLCHGDLFPNQVFEANGRVSAVIDWADALLAPGGVDVGYVCAGIEDIPFPVPGGRVIQRRLTGRFRAAYSAQRVLDPEALRFGEVMRALHALMAHGRHRAGRGPAPVPYDSPAAVRRLQARLARHGAAARLDEPSRAGP